MKPNFLDEFNSKCVNRCASKHSKLSRGPANPKHKIFLKNERAIMRVISYAVAGRNISLKVSEVCQASKISAPTFYLHYRDCNDALRKHEKRLEAEFKQMLPVKCSKMVAFNFLLIFINRYRWYFDANLRNYNMYLLHKLIRVLWPIVVPPGIGLKTLAVYVASVEALILFWCKQDKLAKTLIPHYAEEIARIRLMRWD